MTNWPWIALTLACVIGILFYIRKDHLRKVQDMQLQQQGQELEMRLQETAEHILLRMEQEAIRLEALLARCEEQTKRMEPSRQEEPVQKSDLPIIKPSKTAKQEEPAAGEPLNFAMALLQEELNLQTPSETPEDRNPQNARAKTAQGRERYEQVYELVAAGLTMGEIAQQTGLGVAEVNLLLSLRK